MSGGMLVHSSAKMNVLLFLLVLVLPFLGIPSALADAGAAPAGSARVVRIQLKWQHQFQFAGFYAALDQGYFRDAGLDVRLLPGGPDIDPAKVVVGGGAEFGIGNSSLLISRAWGAPVVAVAAIMQHSPFVLVASRGRGVDGPRDLEGRLVMLEAHAAELMAFMKQAGADTSQMHMVPHDGNVRSLGQGMDAMSAYSSDEIYTLLTEKIPHQVFNPRSVGMDFYGDTLFTSQVLAIRDPALVRAVRDGMIKGWYYALEHPNRIMGLIQDRYAPDSDPLKLQFEADEIRRLMEADVVGIGYMNPKRWQAIGAAFQQNGMIAAPVDLSAFLFDTTVQAEKPSHTGWLVAVSIGSGALVVVLALWGLWLVLRLRRVQEERQNLEECLRQKKGDQSKVA